MGSITSSVGLVSGIDSASLIEQLIELRRGPQRTLERRVSVLQSQQSALLDVNARLLNLKSVSASFRQNSIFQQTLATSSNENVLVGTTDENAIPGTYKFIVRQRVSNSQLLSKGFADANSTPIGLTSASFEFGNGHLAPEVNLTDLNGGQGIDRGNIVINTRDGLSATIDLGDVVTLNEVVDRINNNGQIDVTAIVNDDGLVIGDNSTGPGTFSISNGLGDTTATDLGINTLDGGAGDDDGSTNGIIIGGQINAIGLNTALSTLNDGNGVLIRSNVPDFSLTVGANTYDIDLGRIDNDITTETLLSDLNDGDGVTIDNDSDNPELKIIAQDGTEFDIDLTLVETVGDLVARVNSDTGGHVTLSLVEGENRFELTDTVGGGGNLRVVPAGSANSTTTAEELGILDETGQPAGVITGSVIANADFSPRATTLGDVIDRIELQTFNEGTGTADVTASIGADGVSLQLTAAGGQTIEIGSTIGDGSSFSTDVATSTLRSLGFINGQSGTGTIGGERIIAELGSVLVKSLNGGRGIFNPSGTDTTTLATDTELSSFFLGAGISTNGNASSPDIFLQDRTGATYDIEVDGLQTVQDLIDEIDSVTGGNISLSISGQSLQITNNVGGPENFIVRDQNGSTAVTELGLEADNTVPQGNTVTGNDTEPLAPTGTTLDITNRDGVTTQIDLNGVVSLSDVIDRINISSAGVTASLNATGNGLQITDNTGGTTSNLIIAGDQAEQLGITADVDSETVRGNNLQLQYADFGVELDDLNYGRGVSAGSFRVIGPNGNAATVNITANNTTLYDVIRTFNGQTGGSGLGVEARLNATGDGIEIVNTTGTGTIRVETINGSTARDLNVLGSAANGESLNGSYERTIEFSATDTLSEIVGKIKDSNIPVSASILNTGTGTTPAHITFTSEISGTAGRLLIDTQGADFAPTVLTEAQDAVVFYGADDPANGLLVTSTTNTLDDVVPGVDIDLLSASPLQPVTLTIDEDTQGIVDAVNEFVTAFNEVQERVNEYDSFDVESERRGILLGDPTIARIRQGLFRVLQQPAQGIDTEYRFLSQVGISVSGEGDGQLTLDEGRLREALADNPEAVAELFAAFGSEASQAEEIAPGITVPANDVQEFTQLGVAELFNQLLDDLTNSIDGTVTLASENFDARIEQTQERIERLEERLERERARLEQQFIALETALADLQNQGSALSSISSNVALVQSSLLR